MKRAALLLIAIVIVAGVVVIAIGAMLPQAHSASDETVLAAPPERVFDALTDVERYPEWRSNVTGVEILSTDPLRWREQDAEDVITFEVIENAPPTLRRVRIADPDLPFGGTWTYALAPDGDGTRLRITEDGEVYNPFFRFVSRFVIGHTATIDTFLADLQRRLE